MAAYLCFVPDASQGHIYEPSSRGPGYGPSREVLPTPEDLQNIEPALEPAAGLLSDGKVFQYPFLCLLKGIMVLVQDFSERVTSILSLDLFFQGRFVIQSR